MAGELVHQVSLPLPKGILSFRNCRISDTHERVIIVRVAIGTSSFRYRGDPLPFKRKKWE